jgi:type I restriction enzyme, R subunit
MEHAIRHEIHVKLDEDPAFYAVAAGAARGHRDARRERIDAAKQLELLGSARAAASEGLSETGHAIFGLLGKLAGSAPGTGNSTVAEGEVAYGELDEQELRGLATSIEAATAPHVVIVDWTRKADVQREIRKEIKRTLPAGVWPKETKDRIATAVVDLLRARSGR